MGRGRPSKKTLVKCQWCEEYFVATSSIHKRGCPKYECSIKWEEYDQAYDREHYSKTKQRRAGNEN